MTKELGDTLPGGNLVVTEDLGTNPTQAFGDVQSVEVSCFDCGWQSTMRLYHPNAAYPCPDCTHKPKAKPVATRARADMTAEAHPKPKTMKQVAQSPRSRLTPRRSK